MKRGTNKAGRKRGGKTTSENGRPGVRQESSGEQREMEGTGCEVICSAETTQAVKG